jgi:hypothetical protein
MGNWRCNGTNGYLINMDNGDRWDGTKWIEGSQNSGGGGGNTGSGRYRNCDKESKYTKGCKTSPDGDIGKVQACLGGLVQDGKFWVKTEAALKNAGYPNGFTKKDIDVICKTNNSGYFSIFPNPNSGQFQILLNNKNLVGECSIIIKDTKGAEILNKEINVKPGINAIYIDNVKSSSGIYYIYISNNIEYTQIVKIEIK